MPRAEKEPRQHKYNRQYLEALPRKGLQALAKQEGIKANIKSEDIIGQIIQTRASQHVPEDEQTKRQNSPLTSVTEAEALAADMTPQRNSPRQDKDISLGLIRDARRLLTQMNNDLTTSEAVLNDIRETLTHANTEISKAQGSVKDMIEVRIEFEESIVKRLHLDRHLWDGTGLMPARHRAKWRAFVESEKKIAKKGARTQAQEAQQRDEESVRESLDSDTVSSEPNRGGCSELAAAER